MRQLFVGNEPSATRVNSTSRIRLTKNDCNAEVDRKPKMIYVKATAVGIVGAIVFGAGWIWAAVQFPIWWEMWQVRNQNVSGIGAEAVYVNPGSILLAALIGFLLGFVWIVRRVSN